MTLTKENIAALIKAAQAAITDHADELTDLDSKIGDADHGYNMTRGFNALLEDAGAIADKPLPDALKAAGMKLVMTVGGASGPLFGTFLMALGKELNEDVSRAQLGDAVRKATDAVAKRGKSEAGQKTLLDVLYPVADALAGEQSNELVVGTAHEAAKATIPMLAIKGRASFLGERSIGHMDPGSRSTALLIETIAKWQEQT
ncbi:MAG: dihydroxyacetone kinase subunit L [Rhizobiales bacterium]|nr:dihydroxyacetone kinase subunit L [Hyphomicrobiales bacterium]